MLALRLAFTLLATTMVVLLMSNGLPLAGLLVVPAAVWLRRAVETA